MLAVTLPHHSDSTDVYHLSEIPAPMPGPGEVLVRVAYAALNRLDLYVRVGWKGLVLDFPHIPCSDFSGEITSLGSGVQGWQVGQKVTANPLVWCGVCRACLRGEQNRCHSAHILGESTRGTCAEVVAIPARNLVAIPDGFDMRHAAAASLVYSTAWHSLVTVGRLTAGERVLIIGAGGGVNSASLQIARMLGAKVYVVAASAQKAALALEQGADWAFDRTLSEEWPRAVYLASGRKGIDIVVDNVGKETWARSLRTLAPNGRLLTVGGSSGYDAVVPVNLLFGRHLSILGSTMGTQDDYLNVMHWVFAGRLQPIVDSIYSMARFSEAMTRLESGQHFGKILIRVAPDEDGESNAP
jgi:NADPH:quinone reductase-like Zn-dependent oxidoreductase